MHKLIVTTLAAAFLLPAGLFTGAASAQVAPPAKLLQLLERNDIAMSYAARRGGGYRGGHRGGMARAGGYRGGVHRVGYRGGAYRGAAYRGGVNRAAIYRGGVAGAGVYRGAAYRPYAGRYYRPYAGYYGRPYYRGAYYPYGGYYPYGAAAAGALVGGAIASQPLVTGSVAPQSSSAYCAQRFRSYNPATGTYTGYDGRQHRCP